jgi:queuine tRNA-ribosyltransferase
MRSMGGLAHATRWGGPTLTDSGGYQIFSMGHGSVSDEIKGRRSKSGAADADKGSEGEGWQPSLLSIGEKGARFRSYHDGQVLALSPERSIQVQRAIGADIILVLDECTPFHVEKEYTESSMKRSHRWALRSLSEFIRTDDGTQALYGIVQGGTYPDLREESVDFCNAQPFFGIAVGGSLGSCKDDMYKVVEMTMSRLRKDRPVHLLGIGGVADIFEAVRAGVDTLDCVHPTRLARHGGALVMARHWEKDGLQKGKRPREHIQLGKGQYRNDNRVIDDECQCPTCAGGYTRAYMHHLLRSGELVVFSLIAAHNVFYMNNLFSSIRKAIIKGDNELDREELRWLTPEQVCLNIIAPTSFSSACPFDALSLIAAL